MIRTSIEKMADPIGFDIGMSDNITQAALLNGFCRGLGASCSGLGALDTQACYIVDSLDDYTVTVLKRIIEFAKPKSESL